MIEEKYGKVIKGLGGLYTVRPSDGTELIICRAKGSLHKDEERVLIGDNVRVTLDTTLPDSVVISDIIERKNSLIRPPLANLDLLFITIAAKKPTPALDVVDKLIAIANHNKILPVVVITKLDLSDKSADEYAAVYRKAGVKTFVTSSEKGEGIDALRAYIKDTVKDGAIAAFAGASGVGKSTLMNALFGELALTTGEISKKIERGRHTTRHVELYTVNGDGSTPSGFLADTPGFSLIDFARFDFFSLEDLLETFPDVKQYADGCRYSDCAHVGESSDECAVARAMENGKISPSRLESYRSIYRILKEKKTSWE